MTLNPSKADKKVEVKEQAKKNEENLFNKFIGKVIPSLAEQSANLNKEEQEEQEKFTPNPNDPADVTFAKVFTNNGGKFLYCDNVEDFMTT